MRNFRVLFSTFLLAAVCALFPFSAVSGTLPGQLLRLQVVANSDSPADQTLKLAVRDAVLGEVARLCGDAQTLEQANACLALHLDGIRRAAQQAAGDQAVTVSLCDRHFPTRAYEDFTLPAGRYRTLRVTLGEAGGKNWWCVAFPALCYPAAAASDGGAGDESDDASADPFSLLTDPQRQLVRQPDSGEVHLKFKVVEVYEWLREQMRN